MPKTKVHWDDQSDVPEEIDLSAIWGICFALSLLITAIFFLLKLLNITQKFDPILIFVPVFLFLGLLGSYVRWKSMNERRQNKS